MMRRQKRTDISSRPNVELPSMIKYKERLFEKDDTPDNVARRKLEATMDRPWRVDYDLAYDGGGASFSQWYRTRGGAIFSAFFHVKFRSWGGLAELVHQPTERALFPPPPPKNESKYEYPGRKKRG